MKIPHIIPENNLLSQSIRTLDAGVQLLQEGKVIAYPTETFFALGCKMSFAKAVAGVFFAKGRDKNKPLPLLAASMQQVLDIAHMNDTEKALAEQFWPASLTLLLRAKEHVLHSITADTGKVAVRISPHAVAQALAERADMPLICSSANVSGAPPAKLCTELDAAIFPHIGGIVCEGEKPQGGLASTIIEVDADKNVLVRRQGAVAVQSLEDAGFRVRLP